MKLFLSAALLGLFWLHVCYCFRPLYFQHSRVDKNIDRSIKMTYDVVHQITPELAAQLVGCVSIVTAGSAVSGADNEVESFEDEYDVFRDSPLRYAGYLNEVGEAFRPLIPGNIVLLSYILTLGYIAADAGWKATEYRRKNEDLFDGKFNVGGPLAAIDTLLFQIVASVLLPGFIINRWVTLVAYLTHEKFNLPDVASNFFDPTITLTLGSLTITPESIASSIPTAAGLVLIPLIVKSLDGLAEFALDNTLRPILLEKFPGCEFPFRVTERLLPDENSPNIE